MRSARRRFGGSQGSGADWINAVGGTVQGVGHADTERFDPFYEPGMGFRAGGRILFAVQRLSQEVLSAGLHWEPWRMAAGAYAQASYLGRWY